MTREEFIKEVTTGLVTPPQYFPHNVRMNKGINLGFDDIIERGTSPLDAHQFKALSEEKDVLVLDTRAGQLFTEDGFVPGSWWIGINGAFAPWVGALVTNIEQKIILICDEDSKVHEVVTRLSRVGYDNTLGYLAGGFNSWKIAGFPVDTINSVSAAGFATKYKAGEVEAPIDVRKESEYLSEHVIGLENFPLDFINSNLNKLDKSKDYFVHCAGGYRSLIAVSIMKANGFQKVTDIRGGFKDIKETDLALTEYVCPSTLL